MGEQCLFYVLLGIDNISKLVDNENKKHNQTSLKEYSTV